MALVTNAHECNWMKGMKVIIPIRILAAVDHISLNSYTGQNAYSDINVSGHTLYNY